MATLSLSAPMQMQASCGQHCEKRLQRVHRHPGLAALAMGFGRSGGLLSEWQLLGRLRDQRIEQPISMLAHWIVDRRVLSFEAEAQTWFPRCQFESQCSAVVPVVEQVLVEFDEVLDREELVHWFMDISPWLGDQAPADMLQVDPRAVLEAARIDRFILRG